MKRNPNPFLPWGIAALAVSLIFLVLFCVSGPHYSLHDDGVISRALMGYSGGISQRFSFFVHSALALPLSLLSTAFPGVAWFSWLQIFCLWFSQVVILKSFLQLSLRAGGRLGLGLGLGAGLFFLAVFCIPFSVYITYTITTCLLGAAALLQLFTLSFTEKPKALVSGLCLSLGLLFLAYLIRQITLLPLMAFWLLSLMGLLLLPSPGQEKKRPLWRPLLFCLCGALVLLGGLSLFRAWDIQAQEQEPFIRWQEARTQATDFGGLAAADAEALAKVGWSEAQLALARDWFFLDEYTSAEALTLLSQPNSADSAPVLEQLKAANRLIQRLFLVNPNAGEFWRMGLLISGACLLWMLLCCQKKSWALLSPLALSGLGGLMLVYLGIQGRLPLRAACTVLLPFAASAAGMMLRTGALPQRSGLWRRLPAVFLLALCLWTGLGSARTNLGYCYHPEAALQDPKEHTLAKLDAYAQAHTEVLLVVHPALSADTRLFPDTSAGIPKNLLFWDWNQRNTAYQTQLRQYGFDGEHFQITDFFRENLRMITQGQEPPESFMAYLSERAGAPAYAIQADAWEDFRIFRFSRTPGP